MCSKDVSCFMFAEKNQERINKMEKALLRKRCIAALAAITMAVGLMPVKKLSVKKRRTCYV